MNVVASIVCREITTYLYEFTTSNFLTVLQSCLHMIHNFIGSFSLRLRDPFCLLIVVAIMLSTLQRSNAWLRRSPFVTNAPRRHLAMKLNCGIVGLPNVGKSTLFNALVGSEAAQAANFPFCTIGKSAQINPCLLTLQNK